MSSRARSPSSAHPVRLRGWSRTTAATAVRRWPGGASSARASRRRASAGSGGSTVSGRPEPSDTGERSVIASMVERRVPECAFCGITSGLVYEGQEVVASLDHRPLFPGHVLVVPRAHVETLTDLPAELV